MEKKLCRTCNTIKLITEFGKRTKSPDGLAPLCKPCKKAKGAEYYQKNKKRIIEQTTAYIKKHPEQRKKTIKKYYENNKENLNKKTRQRRFEDHRKTLTKEKEWRDNNKESIAKANHKWKQNNKGLVNSATARRRKGIRQSSLKNYYKSSIDKIYKNCPKGYHVDHIVPLHGENVSGLHVPWNLQYLPAVKNLSKSNRVSDNETTLIFLGAPFCAKTYDNIIRV